MKVPLLTSRNFMLPLLLLMCVGAAQGSVLLPYTEVFGPISGSSAASVFLPQFDPSLGMLQSVQVYIDGQVYGSAVIENHNTPPATLFNVNYNLTMKGTTYLSGPNIVSLKVIPIFNTGDQTLDPGTNTTVSGTGDVAQKTSSSLTGTSMNPYIGTDTVQFNLSVNATNALDADTGIQLGTNSTTTTGHVTVNYLYDLVQVPEPTVMLMMGSGLILLGFVRRLRTS